MRKIYLIVLFTFFVCTLSFAQKDSFELIRTYKGDIADAAIDNLDDLYIISSTGQIKKFTPSGDSIVYDQVKKYGKLYLLDATNPLKLLLFYKDFSTIVVLDRFFATLQSIDLRKINILQPDAIGLSYDNNIWVFDEYDSKLKKIDDYGTLLSETTDFRTLFDLNVMPQKIINDNGFVYLADTANGVFVFDNYGTFKKKMALKNWQSIAINNNIVITTNNELVAFYNMSTFQQTQRRAPLFRPYFHSFTTPGRLVTFSNDTLNIYRHRFQ